MTKDKSKLKAFLKLLAPSPAMTVIAVAFIGIAVSAYLSTRGTSLEPTVTQAAGTTAAAPKSGNPAARAVEAFGADDPAVRYAERLRDASALTMSFSLYALNERVTNQKVLPTVNDVLDGLSKSPLMPPGLSVAAPNGVVRSPAGVFFIRYRPNPFGVEVLSAGPNGLRDGSVFVLRLPEASAPRPTGSAESQNLGAALFVAPNNEGAAVPSPFAPVAFYCGAGWTREPLRATPLSPQQWADMQTWLAATLKEPSAGG